MISITAETLDFLFAVILGLLARVCRRAVSSLSGLKIDEWQKRRGKVRDRREGERIAYSGSKGWPCAPESDAKSARDLG